MSNNIDHHGVFTTDIRRVVCAEELRRREIRDVRPAIRRALAPYQQKQHKQYNRSSSPELQEQQQQAEP